MQRVSELLQSDPDARRELDEIERALRPLEEHYHPPESPPSDLVSKTLANLPPLPREDSIDNESGSVLPASLPSSSLTPMGDGVDVPGRSSVTWVDWVSGALSAAVLLGLLLPSLSEGRFEARRMACQDQLRQFGTALTQFVLRDEQSRLPAVAKEGPEAFAGVYAVRLNDAGLFPESATRWCPSVQPPSEDELQLTTLGELPTADELHVASIDQLRELQRFAGGHYAYTLGVVDGKQFGSPRFESRSSFAIMSDAPTNRFVGYQATPNSIGHSGYGINVLYEDGRVQFISLSSLESIPDHPWLNHNGQVEAGVNIDDASLAPSWRPPFSTVRQR
ncbi:anti-sigma factor family protein [Novipirellula herctigrandis]